MQELDPNYTYHCPECDRFMETWKTREGYKAKCRHCQDTYYTKGLTPTIKNPDYHKRSLKSMDSIQATLSKEIALEVIESCDKLRIQALMAVLYITGARISEVVNYRNPKTKVKDKGIKKFQFTDEIHEGKPVFWVKGIRILKQRTKIPPIRSVPISYKQDGEFIHYIKEYIKHLDKDEPLFNFSRVFAWMEIKDYADLSPHLFRDLRVLDLDKYYKMSAVKKQKFIGWKKLDMLLEYEKYRPTDLIDDKY